MSDKSAEIVERIRDMIEVNMGRPLDFDTLTSQMEGAYSQGEVRYAVWHGVSVGKLDFTLDWRILSPPPSEPTP